MKTDKRRTVTRSHRSRRTSSSRSRPTAVVALQYEPRPHLPDYLRPGLKLVLVGFNPGDLSSQLGHYYAWPGNQFWRLLHESGLTPERLGPHSDHRLLEFGIGITDVVKRWSRSAGDLRHSDYQEGVPAFIEKIRRIVPTVVAFNGKLAYEKVVGRASQLGLQAEMLAGTHVFVLPSSSGRNGSLTWEGKLAWYRQLREYIETTLPGDGPTNAKDVLSENGLFWGDP